jgi:hypothetical protein
LRCEIEGRRNQENTVDMTEHNKIVVQALNDYLKQDNPGYGVLIKGDWGCGKSFFVKKWKEKLEEGLPTSEDDEDVIQLKPIYVTLNGVSSVTQIDDALKRAISPFLHGKFMKGLGKALKLAASVALRVNVDLVGDEKPEQVVCTIDPKTLLEFDPTKVKGTRILIFDDIERAKLPIEEVLGYINYFVEQVKCHVVMVGDTHNVEDKEAFKVIKEKTIGHEYRIEEETEEALTDFIKEIDSDGKLGLAELRSVIGYSFTVTKVRNLRILRQSLYDYKMYVSHLTKEIVDAKEFVSINQYLLANFIVVYAEYKSGNVVMENFNKQLVADTISRTAANRNDKKDIPPTPAVDVMAKYQQSGLTESHRVLNQGYVSCVMNYLQEGVIDEDFLRSEVKRDRSTPWEKLSRYATLSNDEFKRCLGETADYLEKANFENIDTMLMATCSILMVVKKGLTYSYTVDKVIGWCVSAVESKFFPLCRTQDDLYTMRGHAHRCLSYYQGESIIEEVKELNKQIEDIFVRYNVEKKDSLTVILETLTDEKIDGLISIYLKAVPDHSVTYSSHAIFSQVDEAKFVKGFVGLSNASKVDFIQFVKHHYNQVFAASNAKDFVHYYEADLNKLPEIVRLLNEEAEHECLVDKQNILELVEVLTQSGDTMQLLQHEKGVKK